jgi:hypothetical protein
MDHWRSWTSGVVWHPAALIQPAGVLVAAGLVATRHDSYRVRVEGLQSTSITQKLAEHLQRGELLDLAPDLALGSPVDDVVMTSWDGTHVVAAHDIRELLRGRIVSDPDPRGLRLRAACIRGRLRPGQPEDKREVDVT